VNEPALLEQFWDEGAPSVTLLDGTYRGDGNAALTLHGNPVLITSARGPEVTTVDCLRTFCSHLCSTCPPLCSRLRLCSHFVQVTTVDCSPLQRGEQWGALIARGETDAATISGAEHVRALVRVGSCLFALRVGSCLCSPCGLQPSAAAAFLFAGLALRKCITESAASAALEAHPQTVDRRW